MEKGFRAVFVNHCHPDAKHVSALRMKSFANALAGQGGKIVLLTETLAPADVARPVAQTAEDLNAHDWSRPFILAAPPTGTKFLKKAREGNLLFGLRQGVLASAYLFRSGVFTDWRNGAKPYLPVLAETFRPQIVWGTFGNTDAWNISRRLACLSGCPWAADLKDNWSAFLPTGLTRLIAGRYGDAAHMTTFSEGHRAEAERWFGQDKTVIYSGFDAPAAPTAVSGPFRILLTGSLYDDACLARFIAGLRAWLQGQAGPAAVFSYAGNDGERVATLCLPLKGLCTLDIRGFMDLGDLAALQRASNLNVYIRAPRSLFQHKILELLAAGRPVLSFPGESDEARGIAEEVGGCLLACETEEDVARALRKVSSNPPPSPDADKLNAYSWRGQGEKLAGVLERLAQSGDRP